MNEISEDLDNFTCEICFQSCKSDHDYTTHMNMCSNIRKEVYTNGKIDINGSGIYVLYKNFSKPNEFVGIKENIINVKNVETALFRKVITEGDKKEKVIDYRPLLQKDLIYRISKVIGHEYVIENKINQNAIISFFDHKNFRLYYDGEWKEDEGGIKFRKEVIVKLIEQFKVGVKDMLSRFEKLKEGGKGKNFKEIDVEIKDEKLKKMIEEKKIDMRYFNKVERSYKAVYESLNSSVLSSRIMNNIWPMFHVDVYTVRRSIKNQNKNKTDIKKNP